MLLRNGLHILSWTSCTLAMLNLSTVASGIEFGYLRGLQQGAIGDSPQFAEVSKYEAEAGARLFRSYGDYKANDNSDTKVGASYLRTTVAAGGAMAPDKAFALSGYVNFTLASDYDEERTRVSPKTHLDSGQYLHEVSGFGVYKGKGFVAGGGLGVLIYGSETREFLYKVDDDTKPYVSEVGSAAMPLIRFFGGISNKNIQATAGVRFFAQGQAVVQANDPTEEKYEYDIARRYPAEIHADAKLMLGKMADLAASFAYVKTGQASEQLDEFSMSFTGTDDKKLRRTGGDVRNSDHIRIAAGARFKPAPIVAVLGGLSYTTASFKEEKYASIEHDNLGGLRLDVGADVSVQKFRGFLHVGYKMDETASFTMDESDRSDAFVQRTQRSPVDEDDRMKVRQGNLELKVGGGISL